MTTNFGGVDVVPLLGAIAGSRCHCSVVWWGGEGDDRLWGSGRSIAGCPWLLTQKWRLELLADDTLFFTLLAQKLVFAIWGLC